VVRTRQVLHRHLRKQKKSSQSRSIKLQKPDL
jgi:hypothetical protein